MDSSITPTVIKKPLLSLQCDWDEALSNLRIEFNVNMNANDAKDYVVQEKDMDIFISKEFALLSGQLEEQRSIISYCKMLYIAYKNNPCENSKLLFQAAQTMTFKKMEEFHGQESEILCSLKHEELELTREINNILLKYGLL